MAKLYMGPFDNRRFGFLRDANGGVVDQRTGPKAHAEQIGQGHQIGQHAVAKSGWAKVVGNFPNDGRQKSSADNSGAQNSGKGAVVYFERIKGQRENNGATHGTP